MKIVLGIRIYEDGDVIPEPSFDREIKAVCLFYDRRFKRKQPIGKIIDKVFVLDKYKYYCCEDINFLEFRNNPTSNLYHALSLRHCCSECQAGFAIANKIMNAIKDDVDKDSDIADVISKLDLKKVLGDKYEY